MVIDDATGLHRRVDRDRSGKPESGPPELGGQRLAGGRPCRNVVQGLRRDVLASSTVLTGRVAPHGRREPGGQAERGAGIVNGCLDLRAIAHDPSIGQQPGDVCRAEFGHGDRIEARERGPEVLPLAQDNQPGQPRLKSLQADSFEDPDVISDRPAPLRIVIAEVLGTAQTPRTAKAAIRSGRGLPHAWGRGWPLTASRASWRSPSAESAAASPFCWAVSRHSSARSRVISASCSASNLAATSRAASVAGSSYPNSPSGSRNVATSAAVLIRGGTSGRSRRNRTISPPRPIATTTTPTRIAMAAASSTKYTTRWCHAQADADTTSYPRAVRPSGQPPESGVHAVIAQNVVERGLVVPVARGQPLKHKHARHAELAAGERAGAGAADADGPRRHLPHL